MTRISPLNRPARRQPRPVVLLRPVPGRSPIHELWAGTKLIVVFGFSVLLTFFPAWPALASAVALALIAARVAHIPLGALPTVPRWLWIVFIIGGATAAVAGGSPVIHVGTVSAGLGGALNFLRFVVLTIVLLGWGAMVSWTTNVAEIAPALAILGRPLRSLRIPVDDWSVALALSLRAFPMLIDEFRILEAARRLRPKLIPRTHRARLRQLTVELVDLTVAVVTVTLRRADEMGDAITARGGAGQISAARSGPKAADWVVLLIVFTVWAAAAALTLGG